MQPEQWKLWSEVLKNVAEFVALAGGLFALIKWVREREDRAADVLLRIEETFDQDALKKGRDIIDSSHSYQRHAAALQKCVTERTGNDDLDALLRFYVVLYGIRLANQIPMRSLSVCFRYWLAHYFRSDRLEFRAYIDTFYPTLKKWLNEDCPPERPEEWNDGFFRPIELFGSERLVNGRT